MDRTDNALMLAARDGDFGDFAVLFERHHAKLWNFFYRMSGSRSESDDLVQEVFLRMLRYRSGFHAESHFRAWMYQIARHVFSDRLRKAPAEAELDLESGSNESPGAEFEREERFALLRRALLTLTEDKREVLVLARYQELKYDEIGDLLKIGPATVKTRVHRAMGDLREAFLKLSGEKLASEKPSCDAKKSVNA